MDGVVRGDIGVCTSWCSIPSTTTSSPLHPTDPRRCQFFTEPLAAGVNQQRAEHSHLALAWQEGVRDPRGLVLGSARGSRAPGGWNSLGSGARLGCVWGDDATVCTEELCPLPQAIGAAGCTHQMSSASVVTGFVIFQSPVACAESCRQATLSYLPSPISTSGTMDFGLLCVAAAV